MAIDMKDFRLRALSALIIAPVALLAVYVGGTAFNLTIMVFALIALWEWLRLADAKSETDVVYLSYAALLLTMAMGAWQTPVVGVVFGAALVTALYFQAVDHYKERAVWIVFGLPYIGGFALAAMALRAKPDAYNGMGIVAFLLAIVWGTDIGAYFAGRIIGGPKLAPAISPKKTWSGFGGGLVLAALAAAGVAFFFQARSLIVAVILALLLSVVSQLGDLFESWFKRRAAVKQSSDLIPGHGGVLDRIDGLIFAAIAFAVFQSLIGLDMHWW